MKQSLWSLAAAAVFSLMAAVVKMAGGEFGSLELVFYRSVFGMAVISFFVFSHHETLKTAYFSDHMVRSALGVLSMALWFFTLKGMSFGTNMTLVYTTPIFMALNFFILSVMRHERAPWVMIGSIFFGFLGITMILKPEFHEKDFIPGLICLLVSFIDLLAYWQLKKMGRIGEPSWRIVFYFCFLGAIFSCIGECVFGSGFHMPSLRGALCLLGMGALGTMGQLFATRAYAYGNLLLSSCLGFSAIPFSVITGYLLFDDAVSAGSLTAMSLVLASGMTAAVYTKKMEDRILKN